MLPNKSKFERLYSHPFMGWEYNSERVCFSNFEKYILYLYQILSVFKEKFDIKIGKELLNESLDLPDFQKLTNDFYSAK